jgi:hypothetical protein
MSFDEGAIHVCVSKMKSRIRRQIPVLISLVAVVFLPGCSKSDKAEAVAATTPKPTLNSKQPASPASPATAQQSTAMNACTLLTKEEIQAVQGELFTTAIPSNKTSSGLSVSQCYFQLPQAVNSVVITVTKKAEEPGGLDPAKTWKQMFDPEKRAEKKEEKEEAEKEPEKVEGIGDQAFWTGNRVGGALSVLKGNSYLRISVGGAGDTADKIRKSKILAQSALGRL